jgi:transcription elongation factor GreB
MNKSISTEAEQDEQDEIDEISAAQIPVGTKNYITPQGHLTMKTEFLRLIDVDRPEVVSIVHWAASNGDRSENGDYIYGKRRLREIDRRLRFLSKRLDVAEIVEPSIHHGATQIFFGATVTYENYLGDEVTVTIVGVDEFDPLKGKISWVSPVARALIKASEGDTVSLKTPLGLDELTILSVRYPE